MSKRKSTESVRVTIRRRKVLSRRNAIGSDIRIHEDAPVNAVKTPLGSVEPAQGEAGEE